MNRKKKLIAIGMIAVLTLAQSSIVFATEGEDNTETAAAETVETVTDTEEVTDTETEAVIVAENETTTDAEVDAETGAGDGAMSDAESGNSIESETAQEEASDEEWNLEDIIFIDIEDAPNYGYIQDDFQAPNIEYTIDGEADAVTATAYPEKYNGYELKYVPAVLRDQGAEGACWAFSVLGSMETDLIKNDKWDRNSTVFSVMHLAYFTAHSYDDPKNCHDNDKVWYEGSNYLSNGGNGLMAGLAMANMVGPVNESVAPYEMENRVVANTDVADNLAIGYNDAQLKDMFMIPNNDWDGIKWAVTNYGAVQISFMASNGRMYERGSVDGYIVNGENKYVTYNAAYNSVYGTVPSVNHGVMIVGWDDTFPKENFGFDDIPDSRPEGDGAWLVRNSWGGQGYGRSGYFWLSYYDKGLASSHNCYVYNTTEAVNDNVYSYVNTNISYSYYTCNKSLSYSYKGLRHKYNVDGGELISRVGFFAIDNNLKATVTVTDGKNTISGSVDTTYAGFYTVDFENGLFVENDTEITVDIVFSSNSDSIRIPHENTEEAKIGHNSPLTYIHYQGVTESAYSAFITNDDRYVETRSDFFIYLYTDNMEQKAEFTATSITVDDSIGVNVHYKLSGFSYDTLSNYYVVVTQNDKSSKYYLKNLISEQILYNGEFTVRIPCRVDAKNMKDLFTIYLYDDEGNKIPVRNSNMSDRIGIQYSVNSYINSAWKNNILGNNSNFRHLLQVMAGYGMEASHYFGITERDAADTVVKRIVTEESYEWLEVELDKIDYTTVENYKKQIAGSAEGLNYIGSSLILNESTKIRYYFTVDAGHSIDEYSLKLNNSAVSVVKQDNIYYIETDGIYATKYEVMNVLSINDGAMSISYSAYSYVYDVLYNYAENTDKIDTVRLAKYIYLYGKYAYAYAYNK